MYVAWAAFYEGPTDSSYLNVLIPRVMEQILRVDGRLPVIVPESPSLVLGQNGRGRQEVAKEICGNSDAFHMLFFHADTGGRAVEGGISPRREDYIKQAELLCEFAPSRAIFVSPRKEIEAWALADKEALSKSLGIVRFDADVPVPEDAAAAEALVDPKAVLSTIINSTSKRRRRVRSVALLPRVAQEQSIDRLKRSKSFCEFEKNIRTALSSFGLLK